MTAAPDPRAEIPAAAEVPAISSARPVAAAAAQEGGGISGRARSKTRAASGSIARCTPAQRQAMKTAAKEAGLSVAALICMRSLATNGPRARRNPGADTVVLAKLLAEMGKSGSNLNQIALAAQQRRAG